MFSSKFKKKLSCNKSAVCLKIECVHDADTVAVVLNSTEHVFSHLAGNRFDGIMRDSKERQVALLSDHT